jgi:hypothetical protein
VGHIGSRRRAKLTVAGWLGTLMFLAGVPVLIQVATAETSGAAPSTAPAPRSAAAACTITQLCSTSFGGDGANVKTANGKSWVLTLSASSTSLTVEIARKAPHSPIAEEIHGWTFPVKSGGLAFSAKTGVGTIKPGARTSPYATVNVTFRAKTHKAVAGACTSGSEIEYTGTLTGSVKLDTHLTGGGTVSATSFTAKASAPMVTIYKGCVAPNACAPSSTTFDLDPSPLANPSLLAEGITGDFSGKTFDQVTVSRNLKFSKPAGAYRLDESLVQATRARWTASSRTLVVTTEPSGLVTGSVTIRGGTKSSFKLACTVNGRKADNVSTSYNGASWSSPAGKALTAHDGLGGNLVMPLSSTAADVIVTTTT